VSESHLRAQDIGLTKDVILVPCAVCLTPVRAGWAAWSI